MKNVVCLPDLKPSGVEEELQQCEDGHVKIKVMSLVALSGVEKLPADDAG